MELELGPGEAVADWPLPRAEADETAVARPRATGSVTGRASDLERKPAEEASSATTAAPEHGTPSLRTPIYIVLFI
jgi:hypothetical protein